MNASIDRTRLPRALPDADHIDEGSQRAHHDDHKVLSQGGVHNGATPAGWTAFSDVSGFDDPDAGTEETGN
ncbi:hypothetical protein GDI3780 [Gluconacetobacter diazotrophicus PA1 5]|uniref:Uncharacterized protein n=1 Tax=Gluconacetobacter diazotrophicus (strain ATCC 49037 / DSM 5601 / CCUG 37298 / CIP 103539 / LMG 7603 / PAl5) TaxID=272568 RepID=A9H9K9_GLUDA|nr:hypothetical protein GDI3780 [Gluconacetobacter diazotrophicus PA1 5]